MQYAAVIVSSAVVIHRLVVVLVEVMFHAIGDVLLCNANVVIPVPSALLMVEAQGVQELVHNGTQSETASIQGIVLQIQLLRTVPETHRGVATAGFRCDINEICLIAGSLLEDQAGVRLENTYTSYDVITVLLICIDSS